MAIPTSTNIVKRSLIIFGIFFAVSSLTFLSILHYKKSSIQQPAPQQQAKTSVTPGIPVRLRIPVINIDTNIQQVGVTPNGDMDVPNNITDVGWFNLGARPGEKGSAVISGHVNGKNGEAGVFADLSKLKKGDTGIIIDDKGTLLTFIVQSTRLYDPGYAEKVFSANDTAHLNFITCDGVWNTKNQSYTKRLVVFTELTQVQ